MQAHSKRLQVSVFLPFAEQFGMKNESSTVCRRRNLNERVEKKRQKCYNGVNKTRRCSTWEIIILEIIFVS